MYISSLKETTNRESWSETFKIYDDETDELIDLTDAVIVLEFRDPACRSVRFTATTEIIDTGIFNASGTLAQMRDLCPKMYEVGLTIERDDETTSYIVGTISILDGIVS